MTDQENLGNIPGLSIRPPHPGRGLSAHNRMFCVGPDAKTY